MNPTGASPDGDQTFPAVDDDAIGDQNPDGDQHTPVNEIDAPDHHPEGERDPNQRPDADQESFRRH